MSFRPAIVRRGFSIALTSVLLTSCYVRVGTVGGSTIGATSITPPATNFAIVEPVKDEHTFEYKAQQLIDFIKQENFSEAETLLNTLVTEKSTTRGGTLKANTVIRYALGKRDGRDHPTFLTAMLSPIEKWVVTSPESTYSHTLKGSLYREYAWEVRQGLPYRLMPTDMREVFEESMVTAANSYAEALKIDENNPIALLGMMAVGQGSGMPMDTMDAYLDKFNESAPGLVDGYRIKAMALRPEWGGSREDMLAFVRETAANAPENSVIPLIVPSAHKAIARRRRNKASYYNQPEVWQDIETNYLRIIEDFPQSGFYPLWFAQIAHDAGREEVAAQYFELARQREPNTERLIEKIPAAYR